MSTEKGIIVNMMDFPFLNTELFTWVILPLLIFTSRIFDVTLGTIRIILVSRGNKFAAPLLGFFEVLIWLVAISQIMQHLDNFLCYIAYAGGFAAGNYVGIYFEEKLAMGILAIRIVTSKNGCKLKERLTDAGYGITSIDAEGSTEKVKMIYTVFRRKELPNVLKIINRCNSKVFYSIEDTRMANQGVFPPRDSRNMSSPLSLLGLHRLFGGQQNKK